MTVHLVCVSNDIIERFRDNPEKDNFRKKMDKLAVILHGHGWRALCNGVIDGDLRGENVSVMDINGYYLDCSVSKDGKVCYKDDFGRMIPLGLERIERWSTLYLGKTNPLKYLNSMKSVN